MTIYPTFVLSMPGCVLSPVRRAARRTPFSGNGAVDRMERSAAPAQARIGAQAPKHIVS
jgi:hypothetical protein